MTDETKFGASADNLAVRLRLAEDALRQIAVGSRDIYLRRGNGTIATARLGGIADLALRRLAQLEDAL